MRRPRAERLTGCWRGPTHEGVHRYTRYMSLPQNRGLASTLVPPYKRATVATALAKAGGGVVPPPVASCHARCTGPGPPTTCTTKQSFRGCAEHRSREAVSERELAGDGIGDGCAVGDCEEGNSTGTKKEWPQVRRRLSSTQAHEGREDGPQLDGPAVSGGKMIKGVPIPHS